MNDLINLVIGIIAGLMMGAAIHSTWLHQKKKKTILDRNALLYLMGSWVSTEPEHFKKFIDHMFNWLKNYGEKKE